MRQTRHPRVHQTSTLAFTDNTRPPKLLLVEVKKLLGVVARGSHVRTLNCVCMVRATDLDKPFSRLIDWRLMNLLVRCVVDRSHQRLSQCHSSSFWHEKIKNKNKNKNKKIQEEGGGWKEGRERGRKEFFSFLERRAFLDRVEKKKIFEREREAPVRLFLKYYYIGD